MTTVERPAPVQPGEPAPDFTLPALHQEGQVSLADYRGQRPVLLALFRGLSCAFCRRNIASLGSTHEKLQQLGVETLAITASPVERARLYVRFHPARLPLATDPTMGTHRSYGLPKGDITPQLMEQLQPMYVELARQKHTPLAESASVVEISKAIGRTDGFEITDADWAVGSAGTLTGQFLVDQDGIVRWSSVEGAKGGMAGLGKIPSEEELLAAARAL
jgi:peroxiredoxin